MQTVASRRVRNLGVFAAALCLSAPVWALHLPSLHWPWHGHHGTTGPQSVQELSIQMQSGADAKAIPQYWDRNTLLLDMTGVSGDGSAELAPRPGTGWPVRLEFRVRSGSFANLEVSGVQRVHFTVPAQGAATVLQLDPGVYLANTAAITLRWSAADDLPH
jgi:hypothetical protein